MNSDTVYIGQLKRLVELFKLTTTTNASAEAQKTPVSLGKKFVKRIDAVGSEDLDGRLVPLSVCRYILRYESDILNNGAEDYVADEDGEYQINSVRLIELKCSK